MPKAKSNRKDSRPTVAPEKANGAVAEVMTLKAQRKLFATLLSVFVIWIAFLVVLYFQTAHRKTAAAPENDVQVETSVR